MVAKDIFARLSQQASEATRVANRDVGSFAAKAKLQAEKLRQAIGLADALEGAISKDDGRLRAPLLSSGLRPGAFQNPDACGLMTHWRTAVSAAARRTLCSISVVGWLPAILAWLSGDRVLAERLSRRVDTSDSAFRVACLLGLKSPEFENFVERETGERPSFTAKTTVGQYAVQMLNERIREELHGLNSLRAFHEQLRQSLKRWVSPEDFLNDPTAQAAIGAKYDPHFTRSDPAEYYARIGELVSTTRAQLMSVIADTIARALPKNGAIIACIENQVLLECDHKDAQGFARTIRAPIQAAGAKAFPDFPLQLAIGIGGDWQSASAAPDEFEPISDYYRTNVFSAGKRPGYPPGTILPRSHFGDEANIRRKVAEGTITPSGSPAEEGKFS